MKDTRKRIAFMQNRLNQLLCSMETTGCKTTGVYLLSTKLDKEIVKYYKSLSQG